VNHPYSAEIMVPIGYFPIGCIHFGLVLFVGINWCSEL